MATTEFIAAIELGSSKITGVAGRKNSDGSMQILAYAQDIIRDCTPAFGTPGITRTKSRINSELE